MSDEKETITRICTHKNVWGTLEELDLTGQGRIKNDEGGYTKLKGWGDFLSQIKEIDVQETRKSTLTKKYFIKDAFVMSRKIYS